MSLRAPTGGWVEHRLRLALRLGGDWLLPTAKELIEVKAIFDRLLDMFRSDCRYQHWTEAALC
jgi:hypothetical protein